MLCDGEGESAKRPEKLLKGAVAAEARACLAFKVQRSAVEALDETGGNVIPTP